MPNDGFEHLEALGGDDVEACSLGSGGGVWEPGVEFVGEGAGAEASGVEVRGEGVVAWLNQHFSGWFMVIEGMR